MTWRDLRRNLRRVAKEARDAPGLVRWLPWTEFTSEWHMYDQTNIWEQAWTTRWVRREFTGSGAIVELGALIGSSSAAIARGLGGKTADLTVYDGFDWRFVDPPGLLAHYKDQGLGLREVYDRRTGSPAGTVIAGDILEQAWPGRPIEFLYVDLAKTEDIWHHLLASFVPALMVGGVMVQQDWAHAMTPWLHLWHHRWRDHFDELGHVPHGGTLAFRLTRPLPAEAFAATRIADHQDVDGPFDWAVALVRGEMRAEVEGARRLAKASGHSQATRPEGKPFPLGLLGVLGMTDRQVRDPGPGQRPAGGG